MWYTQREFRGLLKSWLAPRLFIIFETCNKTFDDGDARAHWLRGYLLSLPWSTKLALQSAGVQKLIGLCRVLVALLWLTPPPPFCRASTLDSFIRRKYSNTYEMKSYIGISCNRGSVILDSRSAFLFITYTTPEYFAMRRKLNLTFTAVHWACTFHVHRDRREMDVGQIDIKRSRTITMLHSCGPRPGVSPPLPRRQQTCAVDSRAWLCLLLKLVVWLIGEDVGYISEIPRCPRTLASLNHARCRFEKSPGILRCSLGWIYRSNTYEILAPLPWPSGSSWPYILILLAKVTHGRFQVTYCM